MPIDHALHAALSRPDDPPMSPRMAKLVMEACAMFPGDDDALLAYVTPIVEADPELLAEAFECGLHEAAKRAVSEANN